MGVIEGVDPKDLAQAGWGLILPADQDPAPVLDALGPLLNLRQSQAGERFRLFVGADGYRPGESKFGFLARHRTGPGPADPQRMPYYLAICAGPERIPLRFQSQLDVQYAVGRLDLDTLDGFAAYASSVVAAEPGTAIPPRLVAFCPSHASDIHTGLLEGLLVRPMIESLESAFPSWAQQRLVGDWATKGALLELLRGRSAPGLLLCAGHGIGFPCGHPLQAARQGALVCADWPGPEAHGGPLPQDFTLGADDIGDDLSLAGTLVFLLASFGAATAEQDQWERQLAAEPAPVTPSPFTSALAKRLLALPSGGALAVVGPAESMLGFSSSWSKARAQTDVFRSVFRRLMSGHRVGHAMEWFNERSVEFSTVLSDELEDIAFGKQTDLSELCGLWIGTNDMRSLVLIGDPAVRVPSP